MDQSVLERRSILRALHYDPDRVAVALRRFVIEDCASQEDIALARTSQIVGDIIASGPTDVLDLVWLSTQIEHDPRPEMVWGATLSYLADQATLPFQRVTDIYRDHSGCWRTVVLPPFARERFVVTGKGTWDNDKGTVSRSFELVPSARFPHRTTWQTGNDVYVASEGETVQKVLGRAEWLAQAAPERRVDGLPLPIVVVRITNELTINGRTVTGNEARALIRQKLIEEITLVMYQLDSAAAGEIQVADMVQVEEAAGGGGTSQPSGVSIVVRLPPDGQPVTLDATKRDWE
jgi:hypothetical protein